MARDLGARHLPAVAERLKRAAAARAVPFITSGTVIGLGTGSTVRPLLELLGERIAKGDVTDIVAVPTSEDTATRCRSLGIPLTTLDENPRLALAIDGADEIGPGLDLIKGLGGALLREKLVALAAKRFMVIADESKRVRRLGTRAPLPVEVVPFGWTTHTAFFERLGATPALRLGADGEPYRTDGGNYVVDCRFPRGIKDPRALARALARRPGIVEDGLFLGMAQIAFVASSKGVRQLTR
ncbi:MAG: ribose-5-phosphate isomerase RpiA [Gemmatimonadales bacterium]